MSVPLHKVIDLGFKKLKGFHAHQTEILPYRSKFRIPDTPNRMVIESSNADIFRHFAPGIIQTTDNAHSQLIIARKNRGYLRIGTEFSPDLTTALGIPFSFNGNSGRHAGLLARSAPSAKTRVITAITGNRHVIYGSVAQ